MNERDFCQFTLAFRFVSVLRQAYCGEFLKDFEHTQLSPFFVLFSFIAWAGLVDFVEFELDCRLDKLP